jgi:hypothetical protein
MPTYSKAPQAVKEMANSILCEFESHKPLLDARVSIDILFAHGDERSPAIVSGGHQALGLCRKLSLKDRVAGRGDAEITIDADWWQHAENDHRRALLDHELHHIEVKDGSRDDAGRPVLKLRKHDVEFGWFRTIAERHGVSSMERVQAKSLFDNYGQSFWPAMV